MDVIAMAEVSRIARRQLWLITHSQALTAGVSASTIARWVRLGVWQRVRRGVYMVPGAVDSWALRGLSAVLAAGDRAVLSHASAAHIWRFPRSPRPQRYELWVPGRRERLMAGVVLHRTDGLDPGDRTVHDDLPVTTATRTIRDIASRQSVVYLVDALAFALRSRLTTLNRVAADADQLAANAPGSGRYRAAISQVSEATARAESGLEQRARTILVSRGVPPPAVNPRLVIAGRKRRPDLAWLDVKVGLEIHGPDHLLPSQRVLDGVRDADFTRDGWALLYATEDELDAPDELVADLLQLLQIRSRQLGHGA